MSDLRLAQEIELAHKDPENAARNIIRLQDRVSELEATAAPEPDLLGELSVEALIEKYVVMDDSGQPVEAADIHDYIAATAAPEPDTGKDWWQEAEEPPLSEFKSCKEKSCAVLTQNEYCDFHSWMGEPTAAPEPDILDELVKMLPRALRQYRHNDDNSESLFNPEQGFTFGYDCDVVQEIIAVLRNAVGGE